MFKLKAGIALLVLVTASLARTIMGIAVPDSLPAPITTDTTIQGVAVCGGISGTATITMTNADTLIVMGNADFTNVKLSDAHAGTIIVAAVRDSFINHPELTLTAAKTHLNNLYFAGHDIAFNGSVNSSTLGLVIKGDSLTVHGSMIRQNIFKTTLIGQATSKFDLTVHGNFDFSGADRIKLFSGNNKFYGDATLVTWFSYWGTGTATFEFAGTDTQRISFQRSAIEANTTWKYGAFTHSGTGVLKIMGNGFRCEKFIQTAGTLDLNATVLGVDTLRIHAGKVENSVAGTATNKATIHVYKRALLIGTPTDSVFISPENDWKINAAGPVVANYSVIGKSALAGTTNGIAFNSRDAGGNTGWVFGSGNGAFLKKLPASDTVLTLEPINVSAMGISAEGADLPVAWEVNGVVQPQTTQSFAYKTAAAAADNGTVIRAFLLNGEVRVDSTGPMTLVVLDQPRFDGTTLTGKTQYLVGDTLALTAPILAGVDTVVWYVVKGTGASATSTPVSIISDTVSISGTVGNRLTWLVTNKYLDSATIIAVGKDTSTVGTLNSDTLSAVIDVVSKLQVIAQPESTVIDSLGMPATFKISTSYDLPLSYQWYVKKNGQSTAVAGAQDSIFTIAQVAAEDTGSTVSYYVEVTYDGLKYVSQEATISVGPSTSVRTGSIVTKFGLNVNSFNRDASITYSLPVRSKVTIAIYRADGRLVRVAVDGNREAGLHRTSLAGALSSGRYVVKMRAGAFNATCNMTVLY